MRRGLRSLARHPWRVAAALVLLAVAAVAAGAVVDVLRIRSDLEAVQDSMDELSLASVADAESLPQIVDDLTAPIEQADARARDSIFLRLASPVPVVGRQVEGLRDLTGAVERLRAVAASSAEVVQAELDDLGGDPTARVRSLGTFQERIDHLQEVIADLDTGSRAGLLPPLADASRDLDETLRTAQDRLTEMRGHVAAAEGLLAGPSRILVLAGNNAEVRAGMGMPLSAGVVEVEDGSFTSSPFVITARLRLRAPDRVRLPTDLRDLFGDLWGIGREWRTTATSPNFPVIGSMYAEMSRRSLLGPVDTVMLIDPIALAGLLRVTGPIEVGGVTYGPDNVVDELLNANYLRFGDAQEARREAQGDVAQRIFDELTQGEIDVFDLAVELADAAEGRNLLLWSADPGLTSLWSSLDADGAMTEDDLLVSIQNGSASKRDYYLDPAVTISTSGTGETVRVDLRITLHNPLVRPTTDYIQGLNEHITPGQHRGFVTVHLPGAASDIELVGHEMRNTGVDGPNKVAVFWWIVDEGETDDVLLRFTLPASDPRVDLLPAARVRPVEHRVNGLPVEVTEPTTVSFAPPATFLPDPERSAAPLGLAVVVAVVGLGLIGSATREVAGVAERRAVRRARIDATLATAALAGAAGLTLVWVLQG